MAKNIIWKEHFILEISPTDKTVYDQSFNWPCFENKKKSENAVKCPFIGRICFKKIYVKARRNELQ